MSVRVMETQISEIEKKEGYDKQVGARLLKISKNRHRLLSAPELHAIVEDQSILPKGSIDTPPKDLKTRDKHDRNIKFETNPRKV
jgi:hypothetical protein